jgi:antitoxin component YwqK of YwqJK toxin-antitoxin module
MERRALYRNKIALAACLSALLCTCLLAWTRLPSVIINEADPQLAQVQGTLYYHSKLFSGYLVRYYPNGEKARETTYNNGKQEGVMKSWYPGNLHKEDRLFVDGLKQGTHCGWWPSGRLKFEYYFNDDEHNGTAKEWFSDGKPFRVSRYNMGQEDGLQQQWWPDGTVRANYVVKNGQQYGLIGRKFCKNVYKK